MTGMRAKPRAVAAIVVAVALSIMVFAHGASVGVPAVYAQQLSDMTGLNSRLYVDVAGRQFEILTTANFEVADISFDPAAKTMSMNIVSGLQENIGEVTIPRTLLDGDIAMMLDGAAFSPHVRSNDRVWFVTTEFNGTGKHTLQMTGTRVLGGVGGVGTDNGGPETQDGGGGGKSSNGCLIATAAYGTEMAPQVQMLRELRDGTVLATRSGSVFMDGFNAVYYSFSPAVADMERQSPELRAAIQTAMAPLLATLGLLAHAGIETEYEMLAYGAAVLALSTAVYAGPPVVAVRVAGSLYRSRMRDCTS